MNIAQEFFYRNFKNWFFLQKFTLGINSFLDKINSGVWDQRGAEHICLILRPLEFHRITEWFRLKGVLKIISFQPPPSMGRDTFHCPRLLNLPKHDQEWAEDKKGGEGDFFKKQSGKYHWQREKQILQNCGGKEEGEIPREYWLHVYMKVISSDLTAPTLYKS